MQPWNLWLHSLNHSLEHRVKGEGGSSGRKEVQHLVRDTFHLRKNVIKLWWWEKLPCVSLTANSTVSIVVFHHIVTFYQAVSIFLFFFAVLSPDYIQMTARFIWRFRSNLRQYIGVSLISWAQLSKRLQPQGLRLTFLNTSNAKVLWSVFDLRGIEPCGWCFTVDFQAWWLCWELTAACKNTVALRRCPCYCLLIFWSDFGPLFHSGFLIRAALALRVSL